MSFSLSQQQLSTLCHRTNHGIIYVKNRQDLRWQVRRSELCLLQDWEFIQYMYKTRGIEKSRCVLAATCLKISFCYFKKKASRYYYSHLLLHTHREKIDFGHTDLAALRSLVCRSFDHRSCGFLSIPIRQLTSLEPWKLPDLVASICAIGHPSGRHGIRLLSSSPLPQSFFNPHPQPIPQSIFYVFSFAVHTEVYGLYFSNQLFGAANGKRLADGLAKNSYRP